MNEIPLVRGLGSIAAAVVDEIMAANKIMGIQSPRQDAVYNISRADLLTLALRAGKFEYLKIGTQDRLYQPARKALFKAALEAGASGVFLSGSGSTIMALSRDESHAGETAQAMEKAAGEENIGGRSKIVSFASRGAEIISIDLKIRRLQIEN